MPARRRLITHARAQARLSSPVLCTDCRVDGCPPASWRFITLDESSVVHASVPSPSPHPHRAPIHETCHTTATVTLYWLSRGQSHVFSQTIDPAWNTSTSVPSSHSGIRSWQGSRRRRLRRPRRSPVYGCLRKVLHMRALHTCSSPQPGHRLV